MEALEQLPRLLIGLLDGVVEPPAGGVVEPVLRAVDGVEGRVVGLVHRLLRATEEAADGFEQPHRLCIMTILDPSRSVDLTPHGRRALPTS